uniref:PAT1 domain-containing protein n=1 Tax=Syphacia muris TaxID=451379 RepID=A0A0N5AC18_9BILA
MSRLDLGGLRPSCLDDNEVEFEFGVPLDEEDIGRSPSPCEEIDAVNTETFGDDVDGADYDDLEVYSKQTAGLKLDDYEGSTWNNKPSCSLSPPDPSQLPDPTFDMVAGAYNNTNDAHAYLYQTPMGVPYPSSYALGLDTADSLFVNNVKAKQNSIWGAPDLTNGTSHSAVDSVSKRVEVKQVPCANVKPEMPFITDNINSTLFSSMRTELAEIPRNAVTVEELERQQLLGTTQTNKLPVVPQGAIALEDLEKQMVCSLSSIEQQMKPAESNAPADVKPPAPQSFPPTPQMPISFPIPNPMIHPFMLNLYRARMTGQLLDPQKFPLMPPQMRLAFFDAMSRRVNGVGGYRLPVPPMGGIPLPPFGPMIQTSRMRMNSMYPTNAPRAPFFGQYHNQNAGGNSSVYRDAQSKKTSLPSNKTISDFAFDPYAGFMSKKEREWLIKIQLLQCQGSGNPYDDDYYYAAWRERKLCLRRPSAQIVSEKSDNDSHTSASSHYVPPSFVGSLGKPSLSTVNSPRPLIDLHYDGSEDDDRSSVKVSTQKKFRALLMLAENVASYVLVCEDRRRQLNSTNVPSETRELLAEELHQRQKVLMDCLCSDKLVKIVSLNKGRHMVVRTFTLVDAADQLQLFKALVSKHLSTVLKVASDGEVEFFELLVSLFPSLVSYLKQCSTEDLVDIFTSFVIGETVMRQSNLSNKVIVRFWCPLNPPNRWTCSLIKMAEIDQTDFQYFRHWIQSQFQSYTDSVGRLLTLSL